MNIEALEVVVELMALRERMGTGLFVALGIVWYLIAPESLDCTDMETGETLEGCVEFFSPLLTYFCALPPLVLAVFFHTVSRGGEHKPSLQYIPVDEEGRTVIPEHDTVQPQQESTASLLRKGMNLGGFTFAGAYAFIFLVGMLAIPFLIMCGMMGSNCSDSDFLWAENSIRFGYTAMMISFWVFLISSVGTYALRSMSEYDGGSSSNLPRQEEKIVIPCPSCNKKLRFPAAYEGEVQCPNCKHTFPVVKK